MDEVMDAFSNKMSKKIAREEAKKAKAQKKLDEIAEKEKLIIQVEKYKCIWDRRELSHRDRIVVEAAWTAVAAYMGKEIITVKKMWKVLIDHFRLIVAEIRWRQKGGGLDVTAAAVGVKWPYFRSLLFLKDVISSRRALCAVESPESAPESVTLEAHAFLDCDISNEEPDGNADTVDNKDVNGIDAIEEANEAMPDDNIVSGPSATPISSRKAITPVPSCGSSRFKKRKQTCPGKRISPLKCARHLQEVDSAFQLVQRQITPNDVVTHFTTYAGDLLRSVPPEQLRTCTNTILQLINYFIDGETPIVVLPGSINPSHENDSFEHEFH